jgi:predicted DNA-binding transcriptional regulator YafY
MLTAEEASALFVGAEMAKQFTDGSLLPPIESALLKLRAVLPRDRQDYVEQFGKKTIVIGPTKNGGSLAVDREWLMPLQEAAVRRRVVKIVYRARARDHDTLREVEPLGVVFYSNVWYLVAWCRLRGDMRHFRLDRVRGVDVTDEVFAPRPEFSLARHFDAANTKDMMIPVRVWFSRCGLERARRESYVRMIEEKDTKNGAEMVLATYSLEWMAAWLLSFGGDAEALEPDTLRERIRLLAESALRRHAPARDLEPQLV